MGSENVWTELVTENTYRDFLPSHCPSPDFLVANNCACTAENPVSHRVFKYYHVSTGGLKYGNASSYLAPVIWSRLGISAAKTGDPYMRGRHCLPSCAMEGCQLCYHPRLKLCAGLVRGLWLAQVIHYSWLQSKNGFRTCKKLTFFHHNCYSSTVSPFRPLSCIPYVSYHLCTLPKIPSPVFPLWTSKDLLIDNFEPTFELEL